MTVRDARTAGKRVLIVDDNVDNATMMKMLLKIEGYEARAVYDGKHAIETAGEFHPEIVLLDLTLPILSGQEVAAALRENEATRDALIVAISGYSDLGVPPGFDQRFVKPVDHDALMAFLRSRGK